MATERSTPERFEDVDWDEVDEQLSFSLSIQTKGMLVVLAIVSALGVYDYNFVEKGDPMLTVLGWSYDPVQVDWLFFPTLAIIFFYGVIPMYQNPRMTRYYWDRFKQNRPALLSLGFLLTILFVGIVGPIFVKKPELSLFHKFQPPVWGAVDKSFTVQCVGEISNGKCHGTWKYPLGTTGGGKGIFALVIYGMPVSMKIGLIAPLLTIIIGTAVGTLGAYAGGLVDEILFRYVDLQQVFPTFLLYLLISYLFGASMFLFVVLFGFFSWEGTARYVRSNALQKTEEEYIKSAKASGASTWYIIRRHLVPNTASSIITDATLLVPSFLLFEAGLAFLGLGDPTTPSWGQVIASGRDSLSFAWWIATIPGIFLFVTILAFNFLGDAMLDALNPRAETETEE